MKKWIYFVVVLALCVFEASFVLATETEAGVNNPECKECSSGSGAAPISAALASEAQELIAKMNASFKCQDGGDSRNCLLIDWLKWKHKSYAADCKGFFLDEKGELGSFSKLTIGLFAEDIQKNKEQSVFVKSNPDFDRLCPEFKNFTTTQKMAFHGWIFELLAFPESSCNVKVKPNKGAPTTKAVCLYQLEDRPEIRKWRSAKFSPPRCAVSSQQILTMSGCTGCAFDEYKRKTLKDGTPFGLIDEKGKRISGSYWASHNPLARVQEQCLEKYLDPNGKPLVQGKKPLFLSKCAGSNIEWVPRYKYFKRIQRFPLCGTDLAQDEINKLRSYQAGAAK